MTTVFVKIISIPDEELFSETYVGCTASYFVKIIWCSRWFCIPLSWGSVLLYLRSPKGCCWWIWDDLSCSYNPRMILQVQALAETTIKSTARKPRPHIYCNHSATSLRTKFITGLHLGLQLVGNWSGTWSATDRSLVGEWSGNGRRLIGDWPAISCGLLCDLMHLVGDGLPIKCRT